MLKRRNLRQTIAEIITPLAIVSLFWLGFSLSSTQNNPAIIPANATQPISDFATALAGVAYPYTTDPPLGVQCFDLGDPFKICVDTNNSAGMQKLASSGEGLVIDYEGPIPIPTVDEFIAIHDAFDELHIPLPSSNLRDLGPIGVAPLNKVTKKLFKRLENRYKDLKFKTYDTESEAVDHATNSADKGKRFWAIIVVDAYEIGAEGVNIDYKIRMNFTRIPSTKHKIVKFPLGIDSTYRDYLLSGFLSLQYMMDQDALALQAEAVQAQISHGASYKQRDSTSIPIAALPQPVAIAFPVPPVNSNEFYARVGALMGLVLCMASLYPASRLIKALVEEKASRTAETMKIMGVQPWALTGSWMVTYLFIFLAIGTGTTLILTQTGVVAHSSPGLIWLIVNLSLIAEMALCFLVASFFDRPKLAGIVGPIVVFVGVIPRYALFTSDIDDQARAKALVSLLSPSAFAFAMDQVMEYEGVNRGVMWGDINSHALPISLILFLMAFDAAVYFALMVYIKEVLPKQYGVRRPWYFPCTARYWCGGANTSNSDESDSFDAKFGQIQGGGDVQVDVSARDGYRELPGVARDGMPGDRFDEDVDVDSDSDVEMVLEHEFKERGAAASDDRVVVSIRNLAKTYDNGVRALKGLSLDVYSDEITVVLGHNGAGKSTTVSLLTGLYSPTRGDAHFQGVSIVDEMDSVRTRVGIGICPQHSVLFDKLSCLEHVRLYASLKGASSEGAADLVDLVGLGPKRHTEAGALSGGMRRKLSVAVALVGGPRVVFLDEPTSGMDPSARRQMWDLFRSFTARRSLILTTHFMDEADVLGDRVAIMAHGRLKCHGSTLFLKKTFGTGYNLTFALENGSSRSGSGGHEARVDQMRSLVRSFAPGATCKATAGEVRFVLPFSSVSEFPRIIRELDRRKTSLGFSSYGISMTKLEEVFMKIASGQNVASGVLSGGSGEDGAVEGKDIDIKSSLENKGDTGDKNDDDDDDDDDDDMKMADQGGTAEARPDAPLLSDADLSGPTPAEATVSWMATRPTEAGAKNGVGFCSQLYVMLRKRCACAIRDWKGRFFEIILPVLVIALTLLILKLNINPAGPAMTLNNSMYNGQSFLTRPSADKFLDPLTNFSATDYVSTAYDESLGVELRLLREYDAHRGVDRFSGLAWNDSISFTSFGGATLSDTYSLMHNATYYHALPAMQAEVTRARLATGGGGLPAENCTYNVVNHPLPLTGEQKVLISLFLSLFAAIFVLIPFCYLPASFVSFIVRETASKAKRVQLLAGASPLAYWCGNYIWDVVNYTVIAGCSMIVFIGYGNAEFVGTEDAKRGTFLLLMAYGCAALPLAYCYSFMFSNPTSAQVGISGLNFMFGFVLVIASFVLDAVDLTASTNHSLKPYYRIMPPYCLGESLISLTALRFENTISPTPKHVFDWDILGRNLVYLVCESVGYFIITLLIERSAFLPGIGWAMRWTERRRAAKPDVQQVLQRVAKSLDDDVRAERVAVLEGAAEAAVVVELRGLTKVYKSRGSGSGETIAVRESCLRVRRGECFGLLGINGAGKTTTLKVLTGDVVPSAGDAYVAGRSVVTDLEAVRHMIGYCPQFDPLFDRMTGREHLRLFARLRGIRPERVGDAVETTIRMVGLDKYADKSAGGYSGGNKRKLSLGIALIGAPSVVLLDEPSSGMDPVAKRQMWKLLSEVSAAGACMILTTHSLEECEALCSRVGVMVSGTFKCLGSIQHVRDKFGAGYDFVATVRNGVDPETVLECMRRIVPGAYIVEQHEQMVKVRLPRVGTDQASPTAVGSDDEKKASDQKLEAVSLAEVFEAVEANKTRVGITDYSISQATLEQVFLKMARAGENERREAEMETA